LDELDEDLLCADCVYAGDETDDQGDADPGEPDNEELGSPKFVSRAEAAAIRQDRGDSTLAWRS
jgi:hypothetical protein